MDKGVIEVSSLDEHVPEYRFWETKSIEERINALEDLRGMLYDFDPTNGRLSRVLEIVDRP